MDLNERIARLLEPERESDTTWVGYHWNEEYCQVEPRPFDRSIDASMRVIEKRWPEEHEVVLDVPAPYSSCRSATLRIGDRKFSWESGSYSEALALALLAALEAEVKP